MERDDLMEEIRYVRGRVDDLHDRINLLFEGSVDTHNQHATDIARLQEQAATVRSLAGKISGVVSAVVSAAVAGLLSFVLRRWFE